MDFAADLEEVGIQNHHQSRAYSHSKTKADLEGYDSLAALRFGSGPALELIGRYSGTVQLVSADISLSVLLSSLHTSHPLIRKVDVGHVSSQSEAL